MTVAKTTRLPDDMPATMRRLPRDSVGRPVPDFVAWVNGVPDFRLMTPEKLVKAIRAQTCFICGQRLKRVHGSTAPRGTFVAGPMCVVNRTSAEPPNHAECAEWSARACPFLTKPLKERRAANMPTGISEAAGIAILRNPGVTALIDTDRWRVYPVKTGEGGGQAVEGLLFEMARITNVSWLAEGRKANADEVLASIETGLPQLIEMAEAELGAMPVLARRTRDALRWVPDADLDWFPVIREVLGAVV